MFNYGLPEINLLKDWNHLKDPIVASLKLWYYQSQPRSGIKICKATSIMFQTSCSYIFALLFQQAVTSISKGIMVERPLYNSSHPHTAARKNYMQSAQQFRYKKIISKIFCRHTSQTLNLNMMDISVQWVPLGQRITAMYQNGNLTNHKLLKQQWHMKDTMHLYF